MKHFILSFAITAIFGFCGFPELVKCQPWEEQTQQLPDGNGTYQPSPGTEFGRTVAMDGNYAVVGTLNEQAVAYLHNGTNWEEQDVFAPADLGFQDAFGGAVAISGNTIVVGAFLQNNFEGAAYVYVRDGVTWSFEQKLEASDGAANDRFGTSLAINGEVIVIGGIKDKVYVFNRTGTTWTEDAIISPADLSPNNAFGASVGISGSTIAIGQKSDAFSTGGSVYVFTGSGSSWTEQDNLLTSDGEFGDKFGTRVSLSGDMLLASSIPNGETGSAYVFKRDGTGTWSETSKIMAPDGETNDLFGFALDLSESAAIVGAYTAHNTAGTAYAYENNGTILHYTQKIVASDSLSGDGFGISTAVSGNLLMIGSPYHTVSVTNGGLERGGGVDDGGGIYTYKKVICDPAIDTTVTQNVEGRLTATFSASGASYQWYTVDLSPVQGATSQHFTPSENGRYYVAITWNGCTALSGVHSIDNVGIHEDEAIGLSIYPDPASDLIQIRWPNSAHTVEGSIFSIHGQLVKRFTLMNRADRIDITKLEAGSYIVHMYDDEENLAFRSRFTKID